MLLRQRLRVGDPLNGHGLRAGDVADDDRRTGAAGAIRLDPAVVGDHEAVEQLREVLHHVVALRLAVDQHVDAQALLQLDDRGDLVLLRLDVGGVVDDAGLVVGARLAHLVGLREGADGGGRQLRQVQRLLRLDALVKGGLALDLAVRQGGDAGLDGLVVHARRLAAGAHGAVGAGEGLARGDGALI